MVAVNESARFRRQSDLHRLCVSSVQTRVSVFAFRIHALSLFDTALAADLPETFKAASMQRFMVSWDR